MIATAILDLSVTEPVPTSKPDEEVWTKIFSAAWVRSFDDFVESALLWVLVAGAVAFLLFSGYKLLRALARELSGPDPNVKAGRWFTLVVGDVAAYVRGREDEERVGSTQHELMNSSATEIFI